MREEAPLGKPHKHTDLEKTREKRRDNSLIFANLFFIYLIFNLFSRGPKKPIKNSEYVTCHTCEEIVQNKKFTGDDVLWNHDAKYFSG